MTGTEVLNGRVSDRNGPWLSERLAGLGIDLAEIAIVGDRPEDMRESLAFMASQGLDLIVTSGGLGPTADDLRALGRRVRDVDLGAVIDAYADAVGKVRDLGVGLSDRRAVKVLKLVAASAVWLLEQPLQNSRPDAMHASTPRDNFFIASPPGPRPGSTDLRQTSNFQSG